MPDRIDPARRSDAALKAILGRLALELARHEAGVLADRDPEALHDYRVALRRTRVALGQVRGVLPRGVVERHRREFAWLGGVTGPVRDLDVWLAQLETHRRALPKRLRPCLDPVETLLREHRAGARAELTAVLDSARYRRLRAGWERYLARPVPGRPSAPRARRPIGETAAGGIRRLYRRARKEGRALGPGSADADYHRLRKTCKKLRYLLEFFRDLYPAPATRRAVKALKRLQANLGAHQDLVVQHAGLAGYRAELAGRETLDACTLEAVDRLLARFEKRRRRTVAEFEACFRRFAGRAGRRRFEPLLKPPERAAPRAQ